MLNERLASSFAVFADGIIFKFGKTAAQCGGSGLHVFVLGGKIFSSFDVHELKIKNFISVAVDRFVSSRSHYHQHQIIRSWYRTVKLSCRIKEYIVSNGMGRRKSYTDIFTFDRR